MMHMQPNSYDKKATLYAKHRWDYPKPAIDQIMESAKIDGESVVADIGSGPGMLARHFLPVARLVYAVEPGFDMRKVADDQLAAFHNFKNVRGSAEATSLPDASVDLITAGMSIHWFEPELAVREFRRILKPNARLAILRYSIAEQPVAEAISALLRDFPAKAKAPGATPEAFLDVNTEQCFEYTTMRREDEERFVGAQLSAAGAPEESEEAYHTFRDRAHSIFGRFAQDGLLCLTQKTDLRIGELIKA